MDIQMFNHALLAKWKWRCISEQKGRWKDLLGSKYDLDRESGQTPVKFQSWWWRDLSKLCREEVEGGFKKN